MHRLLLLVLLLAAPAVYAAPTFQLEANGQYYSTVQAGCDASIPIAQAIATHGVITAASAQYGGSVTRDVCLFTFKRNSDGRIFTGQGLSCGSALCYIHKTSCDSGTPSTVTWPIGPTDANNPSDILGDANLPPSPICASGCMVDVGALGDCYTFQDGSSPFTFCDFEGTRNGDACSTSDEPETPDTTSCPPGTVSQGAGCVPETPPDPCEADPNAEGCPGGGDPGGGDPGGGDPGGDPCATDPNAEGCPGGGDPGGGDPGGGDPGGGDPGGGDPGGGDPGGGDPGGDPGGNAAGGLGCTEALTCSGDSITCAILNLQKQSRCEALENNDFADQKQGIEDFLSHDDFQPEQDEEIDLGQMFSEGTRFLPSSCPEAKTFSLTTNGGRTFSLSFQPLCQFASDLSYLIVAAAAVFYALYVGRAVGGE